MYHVPFPLQAGVAYPRACLPANPATPVHPSSMKTACEFPNWQASYHGFEDDRGQWVSLGIDGLTHCCVSLASFQPHSSYTFL